MSDSDVAVDAHLPRARVLQTAGDGQQRALARAAGTHHGDELTRQHGQIDLVEGVNLGGALAVDLRHAAQLDHGSHAHTVAFRVARVTRGAASATPGVGRRAPPQPRIRCVEPAHHGIEPEELGVGDKGQLQVVVGSLGLDVRAVLHRLDEVAAVHLQHLVEIDAGKPQAHQHLDDQLVARWELGVGRGVQPLRQFVLAIRGDPVALLLPVGVGVVRLDQSITLQARQGRVDLPDVQRPYLTGSRLELLAQAKTERGTLAEQGQEGVRDAHRRFSGASIPRSILSIYTPASRPRSSLDGLTENRAHLLGCRNGGDPRGRSRGD